MNGRTDHNIVTTVAIAIISDGFNDAA